MSKEKNSNNTYSLKKVLFILLPLFTAVAIQYLVALADYIILFLMNILSTKSIGSATIAEKMKQDIRQPMNLGFVTMSQYILYAIVFGLWYRKINTAVSEPGRFNKQTIFRIIIIIIAGYSTQLLVDSALSLCRPYFSETFENYDSMVSNVNGVTASWPMVLSVIILAPVAEELLFRGLILHYCKKATEFITNTKPSLSKKVTIFSIVFQGFLFGLYHQNIIQFIYAFIMGSVLGFMAFRYGNIYPCILLHIAVNLSLFFVPEVFFDSTLTTIITGVVSLVIFILCMRFLLRRSNSGEKGE